MTISSLTDDVFQALGDPLRREILCLMDAKDATIVESDQLGEMLTAMYDTPEERVTTAL